MLELEECILGIKSNTSEEVLTTNILNSINLPYEVLTDKFTVCIVGGAPSLKYSIGDIIEKKEQGAEVWALNNAYHYLVDRGLNPDVQVMLDARPENIEFVPENTGSTLLYASQCHPSIFDKAAKSGGKIIIWHNMIEGLLPLVKGIKASIIGSSSTVGISAISLAYLFGKRKIHLYGYDSSYTQNENHAYAQPINDKENVIEVTVNGKNFTAAAWMVQQVEDFKKRLPDYLNKNLEITVHGKGLLPYVASLLTNE